MIYVVYARQNLHVLLVTGNCLAPLLDHLLQLYPDDKAVCVSHWSFLWSVVNLSAHTEGAVKSLNCFAHVLGICIAYRSRVWKIDTFAIGQASWWDFSKEVFDFLSP